MRLDDEVDFTTFIGQLAYQLINNEFLDVEEPHDTYSLPLSFYFFMQAVHKCLLLSSLPQYQETTGRCQRHCNTCSRKCSYYRSLCSDIVSHRIVAFFNPGKQTCFEEHLKSFK